MSGADFEKLDVYRAAIEFVVTADALVERLPAGRAYLVDQLRRAATSIVLNIAEGSGEYSRPDKARFYRMARRSGYECLAVLDVLAAVRITDATELRNGRTLLDRIGAMLTKMITSTERSTPGFVRETEPEDSDSDSGAAGSDSDSANTSPGA